MLSIMTLLRCFTKETKNGLLAKKNCLFMPSRKPLVTIGGTQIIGGTRNTSCAIWCLEIKAFFTTKCCMMVGKQLPLAEVYRSLIWVPWIRGTCYKLGALSVIWRQGKPLETILIIFKSIFERCASLIWSVFYMICPVCHILTSL